ncbi:TetR/AcrR family transcriptional regulator [Nocardiopsis ansamitocini]|uniref:TetR family transcriptional regulator n=1 Tax=Nocardiopsis ansamitocini TaxID=1670832 RepID=A0A9W6UIV9_9ACTN|nr:TetR/AcrR family transcriptional regulator [Nocardiopsis ansamitocini]GLU48154.1 TetR family transcriptional regulator [Nocardiopsis ansamitocini]
MARAGLTPALVAAEAARISDEEGYQQLSLATVAKRLGVAVPSLYKHVRGLEGLRRDLALLTVLEFAEVLGRAALGRSGVDAVHSLAAAYRDYATRHPGRYAALQVAPLSEDTEATAAAARTVEVIAAVVRGFGLAEESMVDAVRMLRSGLHGFVDLETRGGFGLPQNVDASYRALVEGLIRALQTWPSDSDRRVH